MQKPKKVTTLKSAKIDPYVGSMLENIVEGKEISPRFRERKPYWRCWGRVSFSVKDAWLDNPSE
jgi:hypothetical protein